MNAARVREIAAQSGRSTANREEIRSRQGRAADQATVNIGLGKQCSRVVGLHTTSRTEEVRQPPRHLWRPIVPG